MGAYISDIVLAVTLFPIAAALLTFPYTIHQYRKFGMVPWANTLAFYTFALYILCAFLLVVAPFPKDPSALDPAARIPSLDPLKLVWDIGDDFAKSWHKHHSVLALLFVPHLYQAFFNILLTLPLGLYLRHFFRRNWWQTLLIGFCVALFFETTQLTGDWFIYECPYRLFDVDDLLLNTGGAMVGYALAGPLGKRLPDIRQVRYEQYDRAMRASATRRALSFALDFLISEVIWIILEIIVCTMDGYSFSASGFDLDMANNTLGEIIVSYALIPLQLLVFCGVPCILKGQTLGQKVFNLRIVRPDASPASNWQYVLRYLPFLLLALVPDLVSSVDLTDTYAVAADIGDTTDEGALFSAVASNGVLLVQAWYLITALWSISLIVRAIVAKVQNRPFVMLNGILSNTRVMTLDGIALVRERTQVMDVADAVALEQKLQAEGTVTLTEMMRRAGYSLAVYVAEYFYEKLDEPSPANASRKVVVLAGSGNNGGDGWVAARYLAQAGFAVTLFTKVLPADIKAEPAHSTAMEIAALGLPIEVLVDPAAEVVEERLSQARVVIDAVLGTGFAGGEMREPYATWIAQANRFSANSKQVFMLAADVPSGMSAQTGEVGDPCFIADLTVTMLAFKPGLVAKGSEKYTGVVRLSPLVHLEASAAE